MKHDSLSKASAYDQARREFYARRHLSEIRSRIAKEEAQHVGAYFGKGPLEIGSELEDKTWESWKTWAAQQIEDEQSMRAQVFSGQQEQESSALAAEELNAELNTAVDEQPEASVPPNASPTKPPMSGSVEEP